MSRHEDTATRTARSGRPVESAAPPPVDRLQDGGLPIERPPRQVRQGKGAAEKDGPAHIPQPQVCLSENTVGEAATARINAHSVNPNERAGVELGVPQARLV